MTIETATLYRVKCDECGQSCPGDGALDWWESANSAEEVALGSGWSIPAVGKRRRKRHECDACTSKRIMSEGGDG